jgi:hypothetical protein
MAEEPDNIVLVMLRRMDEKFDRMAFDIHEIKVPMTSLEERMSSLDRRMDRIEDRVERIERRLDLVGSPQGFRE